MKNEEEERGDGGVESSRAACLNGGARGANIFYC